MRFNHIFALNTNLLVLNFMYILFTCRSLNFKLMQVVADKNAVLFSPFSSGIRGVTYSKVASMASLVQVISPDKTLSIAVGYHAWYF